MNKKAKEEIIRDFFIAMLFILTFLATHHYTSNSCPDPAIAPVFKRDGTREGSEGE